MSQPNAKKAVTLEIAALSYGPYGVGRVDQRVWMVPFTAPGDTVVARPTEERNRFSIGEMVEVVNPSPARRQPPCPYAGRCGGCAWQHLHYPTQLRAKEQSVDDALKRIGRLAGYELRPIIAAEREYHYRRRIRLQVGAANELGFYAAASHELVEIGSCLIADERLNRLLETVRRWARGLRTPLSHVEIVAGDVAHEIAVVAGAEKFIAGDEPAWARLVDASSEIRGLIFDGRDGRRAWGEPHITIALRDDIHLGLEADVFTQVNAAGNRRMIAELLDAGDFGAGDRILELFCGAGNFTLPIARRAHAVVAVEGERRALDRGKLSAQRHSIDNIRWIGAAVPSALAALKRRRERFTKIVLDPPRIGAKGLAPDLAALGADKIFYVSCDPTTLARDLGALVRHDFKLRRVQPIDLFPQTFHVETLAVLER